MFLKEMQIRNYKNFYNSRFEFKEGINVIIGENDCGKSNAIGAIRLILDKRLNWYEKEISEKMFSKRLADWRGHCIIISLRFAQIDVKNEGQAMMLYVSGNKKKEGSLTWFCIPNSGVRKKFETAKDHEEVQKIIDQITLNDYTTFISCGADIDFLDDDEYKKIVGDIENGLTNYTEKLDESIFGNIGSTNNNSIEYIKNKLLDFTYIDALRDAVYDLNQKYNPLLTVLRRIEPTIKESEKKNVKDLIADVNSSIGSVEEIKKLSRKINDKIVESVGNTYAPDVVLKSEVTNDIKEIFRNLKLKSNKDIDFDLNNVGLGSTNIIYIALKLLEYSYLQEVDNLESKYFLLLFEEPEAHLHKHIQMSLFEKTGLNANTNVQVIMTTHSDHISAASKIGSMNIISKRENDSLVMPPSRGLKNEEINAIERYLDVKRSELLFSKSVILVEGDAEEILIPAMVKKVFGLSLDEMGISLINIGSVGFKNIYKLFNDERINKKCAILTDLDKPIDDSNEGQKTAYELGKSREKEIEKENAVNNWVKGFFADFTLEVDLAKSNKVCYEKLIEKTYKQEAAIKTKKDLLKSTDVKEYGQVALSIAKYNGKGWNALLLSELIDGTFIIPNYIVDALCFSNQEELKKESNIKVIIRNILSTVQESDEFLDDSFIYNKKTIGDSLKGLSLKNEDCYIRFFNNIFGEKMIDIESAVNKSQFDIVKSPDNLLVKACPGSGKTRTLIYKMAYHIEKNEFSQRKLISITYTNRAAEEIKDRLDLLDVPTERLWTGTIHQFCLEWILRRFKMYYPSLSKGFKIIDERVKQRYIEKAIKDEGLNNIYWDDINTAFNRDLKLIETNREYKKIVKNYHNVLKENRELDFDLILAMSYSLLTKNEFISTFIKDALELICIDEYQDTQDLQYAIIEQIVNSKSLCKTQVVFLGDPNQAIYGSLGGVVKTIEQLNLEFCFNTFLERTLNGCYRTNQRVIDYYKGYMVDKYDIMACGDNYCDNGFLYLNKSIHVEALYDEITKIILDNLNSGIPEKEICVIAPVWTMLYPFSTELKTRLPNVKFDAPDITPIKRDPLNIFYNISRLLLTEPNVKKFNNRKRIAKEILKMLSTDFNEINIIEDEIDFLNIILRSKTDNEIGTEYINNCISNIFNELQIIIDNNRLLKESYENFIEKIHSRLNNESYGLIDDTLMFKKMFKEKEGIVISSCHGVKGEEYTTVISYGLLRGRLPNWKVCNTSQEEAESKKLLYVIASRSKQNLYLISERGRYFGRNRDEYTITREISRNAYKTDIDIS